MRVGTLILAVCVIGACGGSSASVGDPDAGGSSSSSGGASSSGGSSSGDVSTDGGSVTDARVKDAAREANAPGCPGQFSDTTPPPGHCTVGLSCAYDEGTCKCLDYCGGAPPPPDEDFSHWSCAKYDDCPRPKPVSGSACKTPGKICTYGDCCIEQFTCVGSKWSGGGVVCPP